MELSHVSVIMALLALPKVGPKTASKILPSPGSCFDERQLSISTILHKLAALGRSVSSEAFYREVNNANMRLMDWSREGIKCISLWDKDYPNRLRTIPDPPLLLYIKGNCDAFKAKMIAIVGTRCPSEFGYASALHFSRHLAFQGITIVSGLAEGCDTAAHIGCLEAGGKTIAILAHGFGKVYPASNKQLAQDILNNGGAWLSEYAPGTPANRGNFVQRDRLQSGLSSMIIVAETDIVGGTMHTVKFAIDQGTYVAVLDHPVEWRSHEKSRGNQYLLDKGDATAINNLSTLDAVVSQALGVN